MSESAKRKIIHIDMDAFFASVEQKDNPELRGKPVAVGGGSDRGVVAAASYEARKFGVKSAMPAKIAKRRCPHLIFVKSRHDRYKEISDIVMSVFYEYTDLVEPLSIDEAFLDVTENKKGIESTRQIAQEIKDRIYEITGLTASAGISINKFLAKTASDIRKPNGIFVIPPLKIDSFIENLAIDKFFGVGKVTSEKMHKLGIFHGKDLKGRSIQDLTRLFGNQGLYYYNIARGIDNRLVNPNRKRKSFGTERTFIKDISTREEASEALNLFVDKLYSLQEKSDKRGKTISLKVKYSSFKQITRNKTLLRTINTKEDIRTLAYDLYAMDEHKESIRLLGLSISNFEQKKDAVQLKLFEKEF